MSPFEKPVVPVDEAQLMQELQYEQLLERPA